MAEKTNGAAAPAAGEAATTATAGEFSPDMMGKVFAKFGKKLPAGAKTTGDAAAKNGAAAGEAAAAPGAEAKAAGAAGGAEDGAAKPGEKTEAEKTAEAAAAAAGEGGGEGAAAETGAEAAAGEVTEANEHAEETAEVVKTKLKDLPEATRKVVQSVIDERIGKISAKSKAETERLGNRVVELTTELETTRKSAGAPIVVPGIHPAMLADTAEQIDAIGEELDRHEDMLEAYKETGIEADESKGTAAFTAEQVRARLREIHRDRDRVLPQARALLLKRAEAETALKTSYPALFDPKTDDYRLADALRKQLPELRRLPDAATFVAKFVLGAKALAELGAPPDPKKVAAAAAAAALKAKTHTPPEKRKAPRAPGDGSAGHGSVLDDPRHQQSDAPGAVKTFTETRSRADLKRAVGALVFR